MSKTKKIVLAVVGGIVGLGVVLGIVVALFAFIPTSGIITEEQAKEIVLTHAEVDEDGIKMYTSTIDKEAFETSYDIEFYVDTVEYKYEIDARTGRIEDFDVDGLREQFMLQNEAGPVEVQIEGESSEEKRVTIAEAKISEAEAIKMVLEKVPGATADNLWIKTDIEDGMPIYEGKIIYDGIEYEFELDANEGIMLSWETERAKANDIPSEPHEEPQHQEPGHNKSSH